MERCKYCSQSPIKRCETCSVYLCISHLNTHILDSLTTHSIVSVSFNLDSSISSSFREEGAKRIRTFLSIKQEITDKAKSFIKEIKELELNSLSIIDKEIEKLSILLSKNRFSASEYEEILKIVSTRMHCAAINMKNPVNYFNQPLFKIVDKTQFNNGNIQYETSLDAHDGQVFSIKLSAKDQYTLTCSDDGSIKIFKTSSFEEVLKFRNPGSEVNCIDFTSDLNQLLSGHSDGMINIWSPTQNKHIDSIRAHSDIVWSIRLTKNEKMFLSCSEDNSVKIWNTVRRELLFEFKEHTEAVNCLCLSHSNIYAISGSDDRTLKIWNISKKNCENSLRGHEGIVMCCDINNNDSVLASGAADGCIKIWDLNTMNAVATIKAHTDKVRTLIFNQNNNFFISGSFDGTVKVWDSQKKTLSVSFSGHKSIVRALTMSANGKIIYSCSADGTVKTWNLETRITNIRQ